MKSAMFRVCDPAGHQFIPVEVDELDMYTGIQKILTVIKPDWPQENIKFKIFTDGITNKLVACQLDPTNNPEDSENVVLVRIYGNKTDLLIDRNAEVRNITVLNKAGLAPKIYGVFKNGLSYEYYPGITLDTNTVTDAKISRLVAQQMARMHKVQLSEEGYVVSQGRTFFVLGRVPEGIIKPLSKQTKSQVPREPMVWDKIEQFLSLIPEKFTDTSKHARFTNSFGSVTRLRIEFERLKSHLIKTESPIVFAHNDLLLGNVIYNESKGTVSFIDYEYASYNYQAFDIANHFNEFVGISIENMDYSRYPSKDFQINWIRIYLAEYLDDPTPSHEQIEEIYNDVQRLSLASNFMWGVWSLVQLELSDIDFDFGRYAEMRLNRYFEGKMLCTRNYCNK